MGCVLRGKRIASQNSNVYFRKRPLKRAIEICVSLLGVTACIFSACSSLCWEYIWSEFRCIDLYLVDYFCSCCTVHKFKILKLYKHFFK